MYKTKQLISLILVLAMCLSLGTTAFATEINTAGSSAETPVILNVEAALFSVTIPTGLPVDVAADGTVTVATDAQIINNSHGAVQVVNMTIEAVEGWTIANYDEDLKNAIVDSNQISMIINECATTGANAIAFSTDNFTIMLAKSDDTTDECPIVYNAKVTPLSEAFATDTVANLVFTVDWYKAEGSTTETVTSIPVVATDSEGNNLNATSTDIVGTEKEDLLAKLEESGLVTSADEVDALIEVESDSFDNFANATFDVSNIAQEDDKVVVLHFDETTQQWEYVTEETVDADGNISADFSSFSPVAFVVVEEDGSMEIITPEETSNLIPEGGTYTIAATSEVLEAGDEFPETVADGDIYTYGDYQYTYYATVKYMYDIGWNVNINTNVTDKNQTQYGEILESINEQSVTAMGYTFQSCTSLTTAPEIPSGVTKMGCTFNGCTSLTTAPEIPSGVIMMASTFQNCTSLTAVPEIPDGVRNMSSTFMNCTNLTTAPIIPSSVTNMQQTFSGCTNLKTYTSSTDADGDFSNYVIPDGVTNMFGTFLGCASLTIAPVIPSDVTNMQQTFSSCTSLTTAPVIPNSVTNMANTFKGCTSLTTHVGSTDTDGDFSNYVIPSGVDNMNGTFMNCTFLTIAPELPSSVMYITETFSNCTSLTAAPVIPDGITYMEMTFLNCTNLIVAPIIPDSVTDMPNTFAMCTSLKTYAGSTDADGDFSNYVIPDGVTNMWCTFSNCTSLTAAPEIPSSVTDMRFTFGICSNLTGTVVINANPTDYTDCFFGVDFTAQNLTLAGESTMLAELGATGTNYQG